MVGYWLDCFLGGFHYNSKLFIHVMFTLETNWVTLRYQQPSMAFEKQQIFSIVERLNQIRDCYTKYESI